ncbi:hypothetical protein HERIO_648 [Hepatospora eriocheir]|uniref:Uncharacterized protein n=1 Tax=Hepatospora eriocheir TaxID=1081669 RepID=A0A1X0QCG4_9MICR|nr:hypothetical protein HERIO_648 [Hepatospora eriocheir]
MNNDDDAFTTGSLSCKHNCNIANSTFGSFCILLSSLSALILTFSIGLSVCKNNSLNCDSMGLKFKNFS